MSCSRRKNLQEKWKREIHAKSNKSSVSLLWCLCISIVWWTFDVEVFGEIWRLIWSEIDIWIQIGINVWSWRFQFVAIRLAVGTRIANSVLIFYANSETVVFEWNQISYFACATAHARSHRLPVAFGQFEHFNLISDGETRRIRNGWFPAQCQTAIVHAGDDWTIGQWCWGSGAFVFIEIGVQIADGCFVSWLECCKRKEINFFRASMLSKNESVCSTYSHTGVRQCTNLRHAGWRFGTNIFQRRLAYSCGLSILIVLQNNGSYFRILFKFWCWVVYRLAQLQLECARSHRCDLRSKTIRPRVRAIPMHTP